MLDFTRPETQTSLKAYFAKHGNVVSPNDPFFEFIVDIFYVLCNRDLWLPYMQELNRDIAAALENKTLPTVPTEYHSYFETKLVLYSEQSCHEEAAKNELLKCLLKQEQKNGVNLGLNFNTVPVFLGQVPKDKANELVNAGYLWSDNSADPASYVHGSLSHRIQHYILTRAREDKIISSELTKLNVPLFSHLLKKDLKLEFLFPKISLKYTMTIWQFCLDENFAEWRKYPVPVPTILKENQNTNTLFTSPTVINKVLQNQKTFAEMPYLAFALVHEQYVGIVEMAKSTQLSVQEIVNGFMQIVQGNQPNQNTMMAIMRFRMQISEGNKWHIQHEPVEAENKKSVLQSGFFKTPEPKKPDGSVQLQYINRLSNGGFVIYANNDVINARAQFVDETALQKIADRLTDCKIPFEKKELTIEIAEVTKLNAILRAAYEGSKAMQPAC